MAVLAVREGAYRLVQPPVPFRTGRAVALVQPRDKSPCVSGTGLAQPRGEPHLAAECRVTTMMKSVYFAIAAGLLLARPVLADDQDKTRTQDQAQDQTSAGIGTQVRERAREQLKGEGATGIGEEVRTMAQARERVRAALAEQAGMPTDVAAMPGDGSGEKMAERHATQARKMDAERAAVRHAERTTAREQAGEAATMRKGAGGHGAMAGSGPGAGDCTQAAETTRSGSMRGPGSGTMGGTGPMR